MVNEQISDQTRKKVLQYVHKHPNDTPTTVGNHLGIRWESVLQVMEEGWDKNKDAAR